METEVAQKDTPTEKGVKLSLVITSLNDRRILSLLDVLQKEKPYEIIVADGGSETSLIDEIRSLGDKRIKVYNLPGKIAETRYKVQKLVEGDVAVFIDTDEIPSKDWLKLLTEPIMKGEADFVFGPTKSLKVSRNRITRYVDAYDEWFYENVLPRDISKGPMGNSAWRIEILRKINFDPKLTMGGEDYDFTLNAMKKGYRGHYEKGAVLFHDQSSINSLRKFLRKKFNYLVGASIAYMKNDSLVSKIGKSAEDSKRFNDPLEILVLLMKPIALVYSVVKFKISKIEKN